MKAIFALFLLVSSHSFAQDQELEPSCWENLRAISPGISSDLECVIEKASESFSKLCAADGVLATKEFRAYMTLRARYLAAKSEADVWLAENPGSSQLPLQIYSKIENAETAWMVAGKRSEYNNYIEKTRKKSASCAH